MLLYPRSSIFPGKSTGVGCHFLLQRIFPTQGSNLGLPHCRHLLYHLTTREVIHYKPSEVSQSCPTLCDPMDCSLPRSSIHGIFQARVLEWIAISFSRGPSQTRDQTWIFCIVGRRFTIRATRGSPRQHIKKQRHHFANKGPSSQSYRLSSSHVWM